MYLPVLRNKQKSQALMGAPLHKRPHQNQAIAQKLGILGEKVTLMTGLRTQKYLLGPI